MLDETQQPDLATRVLRYVSYLTIWSNALVAWSTLTLALGRERDTRGGGRCGSTRCWSASAAGIVHFFFLRPILDLHGASALADHLLHQVVPVLATIGFLAFGPRGPVAWSDLPRFLVVPVVWAAYTVVRGAFVDWYPYPFVDVGKHGYAVVLVNGGRGRCCS